MCIRMLLSYPGRRALDFHFNSAVTISITRTSPLSVPRATKKVPFFGLRYKKVRKTQVHKNQINTVKETHLRQRHWQYYRRKMVSAVCENETTFFPVKTHVIDENV